LPRCSTAWQHGRRGPAARLSPSGDGLCTTPPAQGPWLFPRKPTLPGKPARKPRPRFTFLFQVPTHPRPANPSESGTGVGKVVGSGRPRSLPWNASIPHPPAPIAAGKSGGRAHGAKVAGRKGDFASRVLLAFLVFPLNVKKLNACFEFLIRLSSFCHLFCFVMHYIQLHISNPQILPRHQNTCQAFTFRSRRIKALPRLAHITDALASPAAATLRSWKLPPPPRGARDGDAPSPALRGRGVSSPGALAAGIQSWRGSPLHPGGKELSSAALRRKSHFANLPQ